MAPSAAPRTSCRRKTERRRWPADRTGESDKRGGYSRPSRLKRQRRTPVPANSPDERNAGKRWSTRDKRDLADAIGRGDRSRKPHIVFAALGRRSCPHGRGIRTAARAGQTFDRPAHEGGEDAGIEMELASRLDVARCSTKIMCAQYCGRLVVLCNKAQILKRSDRQVIQ